MYSAKPPLDSLQVQTMSICEKSSGEGSSDSWIASLIFRLLLTSITIIKKLSPVETLSQMCKVDTSAVRLLGTWNLWFFQRIYWRKHIEIIVSMNDNVAERNHMHSYTCTPLKRFKSETDVRQHPYKYCIRKTLTDFSQMSTSLCASHSLSD